MYLSFTTPLRLLKLRPEAVNQIISAKAGMFSGLHLVSSGLTEYCAVAFGTNLSA